MVRAYGSHAHKFWLDAHDRGGSLAEDMLRRQIGIIYIL